MNMMPMMQRFGGQAQPKQEPQAPTQDMMSGMQATASAPSSNQEQKQFANGNQFVNGRGDLRKPYRDMPGQMSQLMGQGGRYEDVKNQMGQQGPLMQAAVMPRSNPYAGVVQQFQGQNPYTSMGQQFQGGMSGAMGQMNPFMRQMMGGGGGGMNHFGGGFGGGGGMNPFMGMQNQMARPDFGFGGGGFGGFGGFGGGGFNPFAGGYASPSPAAVGFGGFNPYGAY